MRCLLAFGVALITNLEPIYGTLLAFIFFGTNETMSPGFYLSATLILAAAFGYPVYKNTRYATENPGAFFIKQTRISR